jgi:hypothetical protein
MATTPDINSVIEKFERITEDLRAFGNSSNNDAPQQYQQIQIQLEIQTAEAQLRTIFTSNNDNANESKVMKLITK